MLSEMRWGAAPGPPKPEEALSLVGDGHSGHGRVVDELCDPWLSGPCREGVGARVVHGARCGGQKSPGSRQKVAALTSTAPAQTPDRAEQPLVSGHRRPPRSIAIICRRSPCRRCRPLPCCCGGGVWRRPEPCCQCLQLQVRSTHGFGSDSVAPSELAGLGGVSVFVGMPFVVAGPWPSPAVAARRNVHRDWWLRR